MSRYGESDSDWRNGKLSKFHSSSLCDVWRKLLCGEIWSLVQDVVHYIKDCVLFPFYSVIERNRGLELSQRAGFCQSAPQQQDVNSLQGDILDISLLSNRLEVFVFIATQVREVRNLFRMLTPRPASSSFSSALKSWSLVCIRIKLVSSAGCGCSGSRSFVSIVLPLMGEVRHFAGLVNGQIGHGSGNAQRRKQ